MKSDVKAAWVSALRSGEYAQGKGVMWNQTRNEWCCLGVLCDLAVKAGVVRAVPADWGDEGTVVEFGQAASVAFLPSEVVEWSGVASFDPDVKDGSLSTMNDNRVPFDAIATLIEDQL